MSSAADRKLYLRLLAYVRPHELEIDRRPRGSTWVTGAYDPSLNLVYWGTGNPAPDSVPSRP